MVWGLSDSLHHVARPRLSGLAVNSEAKTEEQTCGGIYLNLNKDQTLCRELCLAQGLGLDQTSRGALFNLPIVGT